MKPQYAILALLLVVVLVISIAGFRGDHFSKPPFEVLPDMNYQDKVKDQVPSAFFSDGNSARAPIPGTVAEEMPVDDSFWATGKWDETHWGDGIPVHDAVDGGRPLRIDEANMARGRERYTISCAVCHGAAGDGQGITSKYGLNGAASYHVDRLRQETDGQLFDTITNGKGQMLGYGYNVTIDDRWRIVMYIRALQRSQNAQVADAAPDEQAQLQKTIKPATPPPAPVPSAPAPAGTPAPAKPAGSALNKNTSGRFSFDVGYIIPTHPSPTNQALPSGPLEINYGKPYQAPLRNPGIVYLSQKTVKGWYDGYQF
jgi:mono/diheme cytochrome c family protein